MATLLKHNKELLEAVRKNKAKVDALRIGLGQMQKALEEGRLKLIQVEELQGKLNKLNERAIGLKTKVQ